MLEKFLYLSDLFAIYGKLLTEKQQQCLEMSLYEDFSLSEIAAELGISRQAVYDTLHRCEALMQGYEEKLQLLAQKEAKVKALTEIANLVDRLQENNKAEIKPALLQIIDNILK